MRYRESGKSGHQAYDSDDCEAQILAGHYVPCWNAASEKKSQEEGIVDVCDGESHHTAREYLEISIHRRPPRLDASHSLLDSDMSASFVTCPERC